MSLLNPKTNAERGLHIILSWSMLIGAVYYLITTFDIIPDGSPIGFLDDIILFIVAGSLAFKVWARVQKRGKAARSGLSRYLKDHNMLEIIFSLNFWVMVVFVGLAVAYFNWTFDFIPDGITSVGYFDDAIAAITSMLALYRFYQRKK